ncbi:MAG: undecaprenyl-diphosphatase UppP [Gemmatimonadaceae bacterium]|jgi:undecaprenyl-diphosphatase|nr:undecaprenyl-diphosphatase UppP [Gemmatimonadaceae bacterium]
MTVLQAIVLGIVQGLAEFLPISSSAHLSLVPWLFGWQDPGLSFDVALHVGTLVAVLWYFRAEWVRLVRGALSIVRQRAVRTEDEWRVVYIAVATVPGAVAGLLLQDLAETVFRAPVITGIMLIVMGTLLWAADRWAAQTRTLPRMRWVDALLIGIAQACALVPGVSRSGATMTAGRALGFDRTSAAVFSFLMSMPITAAAAVLKVPDAIRQATDYTPLIAGIIAAGISSWLAIAVLLRFISRNSFGIFAVYRWALGLLVLWLVQQRGVTF